MDSNLIFTKKAVVRLLLDGAPVYGLLEDGQISLYEDSPFAGGVPGSQKVPLDEAKLLAPCEPSKVVAVGLNYKAHAKEVNKPLPEEPMIFIKPSTSVIGPGDNIIYPPQATRVDHEAELAIVISKTCKRVSEADAAQYILGYTCLNDVTERKMQAKDIQYTRAKGFDTFCPLGPAIALDVDPSDIYVRSYLNGEIKQDSRTSDLIFSVGKVVEFISSVMTLNPGDVIASGTPSGISPMADGDVIAIELENIGRLENKIIKE